MEPRGVRVALCAPYETGRVSGISVFVRDLAASLRERGVDVTVLSPDIWPSIGRVPPGLRNLALAGRTFSAVVRRGPWTVVHGNQPHIQSVAAQIAARIRGARVVVTYHSDLVPNANRLAGAAQRLSHRLLRQADLRAFVSRSLRDGVGTSGDLLIYLGPDESAVNAVLARSLSRRTDRIDFVFAGRQARSKGLHELLEAAIRLAGGRYRARFALRLIGDVPPEEQAARDAFLSRLRGVAEDVGIVSGREAILEEFARAHVVVLPSYHEGLPLVLFEAMAVGCVPIASRVGGMPELVLPGRTGLLVPPGDATALAEAMAWTIDHPEDLDRLSKAARAFIADEFSFRRTVEAYLLAYGGESARRARSGD